MKEYYGTKKVHARRDDIGSGEKISEGYTVSDPTGENDEAWFPKDLFEKTYRDSGRMNFGDALEELKEGRSVSRIGWNGPGQFVYYVPPASYAAQTNIARATFGDTVPYRAYLALKTLNNDVAFWVPSISDCLAEDWYIFQTWD